MFVNICKFPHLKINQTPLFSCLLPQLQGYRYYESEETYRIARQISSLPHQSITALFYHPRYDHLFIVSVFYLYIYQKSDVTKLDESLCSVAQFGYFFNCTESYYQVRLMDAHLWVAVPQGTQRGGTV